MPLVEIKRKYSNAVLYACEVPEVLPEFRVRYAVGAAIRARANLARAYLAGADLSGAYLAGAYLADADLAGAYLAGADLSGAYLAGAYLAGAYLAGANLARAYLAGAYLAGADFAGADLAGAKWTDSITINRAPLQVHGLRWKVYILDEHMQIGCELHSLKEWAEFDDRRIAAMDGRDALRFWRANKDALLALAHSDGRGTTAN